VTVIINVTKYLKSFLRVLNSSFRSCTTRKGNGKSRANVYLSTIGKRGDWPSSGQDWNLQRSGQQASSQQLCKLSVNFNFLHGIVAGPDERFLI
jgi:hypothetical protein